MDLRRQPNLTSTYHGVNARLVTALVGAFNQEKAPVGAFSVIVQLHRLIDLGHHLQHRLQSTAPSTVHIYPIYLRNSWSASRNALKERPIKKYPISEMQHSTSKPQVCVLGREQHVYLFTTALALKR